MIATYIFYQRINFSFNNVINIINQITVSHHDGSPLDRYRLLLGRLDMSAEVVMKSGGRRSIDTRMLKMSTDHEGVFEMKLYLRTELGKFCINEMYY